MCIRADFDFAYGNWFRDLKANSVELNLGFCPLGINNPAMNENILKS